MKKLVSVQVMVFISIAFSSCYLNFYRTNTQTGIDKASFKRIQAAHKYYIVHIGTGVQGLEEVTLSNDTIRGMLVPLSVEHSKHLNPKIEGNNRVKKRDKLATLMEVHLYTDRAVETATREFIAPVTKINRMDVYELNESATKANHILSTVGIIAGGVTVGLYVAAIITLATECNCPQVYINSNGQYQFTSGLYSGAIYSTLERTDYLPLKSISKATQELDLKISNAKNEEQYINQVQLVQVNHALDTKVLPDRHGNILPYRETSLPVQALSDNHDVLNLINKTDEQYYSFDNGAGKHTFSSLLLKFKKAPGAQKIKLVINGRNSKWAGYVHEKFVSMFGESYSKWRDRQEKADPETLNQWQTDQALPLMVYVKTKKDWKFVDYFPLIGNTASRDLIMELEVPDTGNDECIIKLETAYRFWDIDYASIDCSNANAITSNVIKASQAIKTDGTDESKKIYAKDTMYSHLVNEESINFKFTLLPSTMSSSYFLVSGGFYHNLHQYTGKANTLELYKFRKKGAFDRFSRIKYSSLQQQLVAVTKKGDE